MSTRNTATLILERDGAIARPVDVARVVAGCGMPLHEAHDAVTRLANDETVALSLDGADATDRAIAALSALGVRCTL